MPEILKKIVVAVVSGLLLTLIKSTWDAALKYIESTDPSASFFSVLVLELTWGRIVGYTVLLGGGTLILSSLVWRYRRRKLAKSVLRQLIYETMSPGIKQHRATIFKYYSRSHPRGWFRGAHVGRYLRSPEPQGSYRWFGVGNSPRECFGIAGLIWFQDVFLAESLPDIRQCSYHSIGQVSALPGGQREAVQEYLARGNLHDNLKLLKTMKGPAQLFVGTVIRKPDGSKWGVLLLDSTESDEITAKTKENFESFAVTLSYLL